MKSLEVLLCLGLAGGAASIQLDGAKNLEDETKVNLARAQLVQIGKALSVHQIKARRFPAENEFLSWLTGRLQGLEDAKNDRDPWGTPLRYERVDGGFRLQSAGPSSSFGTNDDIRYE